MRTSDPVQHAASQAIWRAMDARDDLYLDRYEGWYSVRDEAYYDDSELTGGEGGAKLSPQGTPVEWTVEASWFFRRSAYHYRKSVVSGKSVSVRVDLGGRRIIKKKNKH